MLYSYQNKEITRLSPKAKHFAPENHSIMKLPSKFWNNHFN